MSVEYFADETTALWRGDSLAVLRQLPDASIDAVITDPPYSSGGFTRGDRTGDTKAKYLQSDSGNRDRLEDFAGDNRDQRGFAFWCTLWLSECLRIARPGSPIALFTDWRQLPITTDALQAGGWVWRGIVPWWKPSARPQAGRSTSSCEYVVWGSRGPMPVDYSAPVLPGFYQASPPRDRDHITQKPLSIMREIVRICPPSGAVLDPFMGSGTTGVAAALEGRRFVGCEIVDEHLQIAERRIRSARLDFRPVGDQGAFDLEGEAST